MKINGSGSAKGESGLGSGCKRNRLGSPDLNVHSML